MKKAFTSMSVLLLLVVLTMTACSGKTDEASNQEAIEKIKITTVQPKQELVAQFEAMVKEYNQSQNKVEVTIVTNAGENSLQQLTTMYASNNAPNIMTILSEYPQIKDKLADLSDSEWVSKANAGTLDYVTEDGKVFGMPLAIEGFGLLYNKSVLDKAVGGEFDPATIKTQDALKALFEQIESTGVSAVHISPLDWSLGMHMTNVFMSNEGSTHEERLQYLEKLQTGQIDLATDTVFNGWLDTFELLKEFNSSKDSPLEAQYDDGPLLLADGEVGTWFMGNWAYPSISELDPEGEYGFLPVPISNNADDHGNQSISVGVPMYWVVDGSQATEEEQQASKDFLNWMVSSEKGQDYYVNQFSFVPAFSHFQTKPEDSVSQSLMNYSQEAKNLEWMNTYYPATAFPSMASTMQKYLANAIDRTAFIEEFQKYWNTAKVN